ncbi:MAG: hypothetical protein HZB76_00065 [Chlamydiae bacterium]|nr:hypothetical protein [Chlamydiota bacterium]
MSWKSLIFLLAFGYSSLFSLELTELNSPKGQCKVLFPKEVHHLEQFITQENEQSMKYDLYLADINQDDTLFMLIAHYPMAIPQNKEEASLQSFLNGLLNSKSQNHLQEASFVDFQGHKALQFLFIDSGRYFKGLVFIIESKLYLIAMECDEKSYDDALFKKVVESFSAVKK